MKDDSKLKKVEDDKFVIDQVRHPHSCRGKKLKENRVSLRYVKYFNVMRPLPTK